MNLIILFAGGEQSHDSNFNLDRCTSACPQGSIQNTSPELLTRFLVTAEALMKKMMNASDSTSTTLGKLSSH